MDGRERMTVMDLAPARPAAVPLDWVRQVWDGLEGLALLREALTGPLAGRIAMVSSFGAESAVLLDMIATGAEAEFRTDERLTHHRLARRMELQVRRIDAENTDA